MSDKNNLEVQNQDCVSSPVENFVRQFFARHRGNDGKL